MLLEVDREDEAEVSVQTWLALRRQCDSPSAQCASLTRVGKSSKRNPDYRLSNLRQNCTCWLISRISDFIAGLSYMLDDIAKCVLITDLELPLSKRPTPLRPDKALPVRNVPRDHTCAVPAFSSAKSGGIVEGTGFEPCRLRDSLRYRFRSSSRIGGAPVTHCAAFAARS
jgi:hypothetical protein